MRIMPMTTNAIGTPIPRGVRDNTSSAHCAHNAITEWGLYLANVNVVKNASKPPIMAAIIPKMKTRVFIFPLFRRSRFFFFRPLTLFNLLEETRSSDRRASSTLSSTQILEWQFQHRPFLRWQSPSIVQLLDCSRSGLVPT